MAFDLPTQMGYDSDDADRARRGRQGRRGDRLDRRHADALRRHPAGRGLDVDDDQRPGGACCCCSTSWSPRSRASPGDTLTGTIQNDVLKEYIARGTYIYPPKQSLRLITDIFAYCRDEIPRWNTISISGYHMAEAGATPAQEIAFTLANGIEYVRAARRRRAGRRRLRAAAVVLLRRPHDAAGGGREVPRGPADLGAGDARRVRRAEPQVADAALPHPDRRRAADRAAARGQPGPGRRAGRWPRCSAAPSRCTPTPSTRRSRCRREKAARLALRTQQVHRLRDRRDQDRRPVRRLVRRRVDDRRGRGGGPRADGPGRGPRRRGRRDRAGLPEERDRASRRTGSPRRSTPASGSWSGVNRFAARRRRSRTSRCASTRRSRPQQAERLAALRAERDHGAVDAAPRRAAKAAPRAPTTCSTR